MNPSVILRSIGAAAWKFLVRSVEARARGVGGSPDRGPVR